MILQSKTPISDFISIIAGSVYIIPLILYYVTQNSYNFDIFLGTTGTTIISELIKKYLIGRASQRPDGAKNCDMLCMDGNQSGYPGMPSSHASTVTFFAVMYWYKTDSYIIRSLLIIFILSVLIARFVKHCHTINQLIGGVLLGLILSIIWNCVSSSA